MRQTEVIHLPRWILEARGQFVVRLTSWWTRDPKPVKSKHSELKIPVKHAHSFCFLLRILMILGEKPWSLPWLSSGSSWLKTRWRWWRDCEICLTSWERCRDGGSDRANCSCCPCDEPHERVWGETERERERQRGAVGKDGACRSHQDKLEKSNFKTMSSPSKLAEAVKQQNQGRMDLFALTGAHRPPQRLGRNNFTNHNDAGIKHKPVQRGVVQRRWGASWPLSPVSLRYTPFNAHRKRALELFKGAFYSYLRCILTQEIIIWQVLVPSF